MLGILHSYITWTQVWVSDMGIWLTRACSFFLSFHVLEGFLKDLSTHPCPKMYPTKALKKNEESKRHRYRMQKLKRGFIWNLFSFLSITNMYSIFCTGGKTVTAFLHILRLHNRNTAIIISRMVLLDVQQIFTSSRFPHPRYSSTSILLQFHSQQDDGLLQYTATKIC